MYKVGEKQGKVKPFNWDKPDYCATVVVEVAKGDKFIALIDLTSASESFRSLRNVVNI